MLFNKREHLAKIINGLGTLSEVRNGKINVEKILECEISNKIYESNHMLNSSIKLPLVSANTYKIKKIDSDGIVINKPGTYKLVSNIKWKPNDNSVCISIECGGVVFDMCGYSIECVDTQPNKNVIGLSIKNVSEVNVKNGIIKSMSMCGIYMDGVSNVHIKNIKVEGVGLDNLDIRYLTPCGIYIQKSYLIKISECEVSNLKTKTDSGAGIQLVECIDGVISNCLMKNFINYDGGVQGYSYLMCENIHTNGSNCDNFHTHFNGNILGQGHTSVGFIPIFSLDLTFNDCISSNIVGCCDDAHGMSLFLVSNVIVDNYKGFNILDGVSELKSGAKATGLEVYGCGVIVKNSICSNIKAICPQDLQASGFSVAGIDVEFENCESSNVIVVDSNDIPILHPFAYGVGFGWAPDPRPEFSSILPVGIRYINCIASECQIGFDTWSHINSKWTNTNAKKCLTCYLIETNGKRKLSCEPCSECIPSIIVELENKYSNNVLCNVKCDV